MPYVCSDPAVRLVSLRIVPLALHWQAVSYFAVWPPSLRERPQCGVHLHNSGRSGVQRIYPWTHGTFRLRHGLRDGLRENEFELPVSVLS